MSYSALTSKYIPSSFKYSSRYACGVDSVAIHCMAGNLSIEQCGSMFQQAGRNAASNYGIGSDGRIACYVDEEYGAWCTSSERVDRRAISIEVADMGDANNTITDAAYNSLINLLVDICQRYNMTLRWMADKTYGVAAANSRGDKSAVALQNMFAHRWFANKLCPGNYIYEREGQIAREVNARIGKSSTQSAVSGITVDKLIFIGDSRTVGMRDAVGGDGHVWKCLEGKGYDWMVNTAVPEIESQITGGVAVIFLMGINDFLHVNASKYADYVNSKATDWKAKGAVTYFVSINPVQAAGKNGILNTAISAYNNQLRNALSGDVCFIDTFNAIIDKFGNTGKIGTTDGVHYSAETYKFIYNTINDVIKVSSGEYINGASSISQGITEITMNVDYESFKPYMVTIDRNTSVRQLDFDRMKDFGVCAVCLEAGYLFDDNHNKVANFRNPTFASTIDALEEHNLPHAWFMTCRARSEDEAKKEMYELQFLVRLYPPVMGVWLKLEIDGSQDTIQKILDRYRYELLVMGLDGKMGLYITRAKLNTLNWTQLQSKWRMWLVEHVDSDSEIQKEVNPEFFDLDNDDGMSDSEDAETSEEAIPLNTVYRRLGRTS